MDTTEKTYMSENIPATKSKIVADSTKVTKNIAVTNTTAVSLPLRALVTESTPGSDISLVTNNIIVLTLL